MMTAAQPDSPVTEGIRSLEVRWIFPGQLETAVAGWFARFPAELETREDTYLLTPRLRGLSVKLRAGAALEVKAYQGSPGILDMAGCARGRMESWLKWSFPFGPPSHGGRDPAGWRLIRKTRRHQPVFAGQRANPVGCSGAGRGSRVRGGTDRGPHPWRVLVDARLRIGRPSSPAPQPARGHRRARVRRAPAG